jgi:tetratricopeptide (TPR) repeat protein
MGQCRLALAVFAVLVTQSARADMLEPDYFLSKGQCWSEAGRSWEKQVEACTDIIDPRLRATPSGRAKALFHRGWARVFLCQYDRAITDFGLANDIVADATPIRDGLAEAVRRKRLYARAERELIALWSQAGGFQVSGVSADMDRLRVHLALRDLREAVAVVPNESAVHMRLADGLLRVGQYRDALDEYAQVPDPDGRNDRWLLGRADARLALGDPEGARDDIMEAIRRMSGYPCGSRLLSRMGKRAGRLN